VESAEIGIPGTPSHAASEGEQAQRQERGPRGERGDGRRERGERGGEGRRERGDRGPRTERGPRPDGQPADANAEVQALAGAAGSVGDVAESGAPESAPANAVLESHTHADGQRPQADGEEPRRGRSRGGRDRRGERGDRPQRDDGFVDTMPAGDSAVPVGAPQQPAAQPPVGQRYATGFASQDGNVAAAGGNALREEERQAAPVREERAQQRSEPMERPQQQPARAEPVRAEAQRAELPRTEAPRAEAAPARGLPQVQRFELPVSELAQVAQGSGLQWVNSDADKIAAVQAAIAAEPKPVHMPRERAPVAVVEEGPLVLVETKRDLREMKLPFEQQGTPPQL
jgi:ribonuclease E